jgi:hypothetical protein
VSNERLEEIRYLAEMAREDDAIASRDFDAIVDALPELLAEVERQRERAAAAEQALRRIAEPQNSLPSGADFKEAQAIAREALGAAGLL